MADTNEPGPWVKYVTGERGVFGHANKHSVGDAIKQNFKWETGNKGVAFARGAGVAVGLAAAGDALLRSKGPDGDDRSALVRLGEGVLGLGAAAVSLAGRRV